MRTARATPFRFPDRGTHGLLQLHRRLLQSHPAALRPGVSLAHLLRTGDANRPTARYPLVHQYGATSLLVPRAGTLVLAAGLGRPAQSADDAVPPGGLVRRDR